jgi:pSer/pThr/pTyr-binding forkhead associated (FHA) protein
MVVHSPSKPTTTPWPALLPMGALAGKPPVPIARPATLVGSRQTANLRLHSSTVSKAHALILSSDSKVHIRDLNSRTKLFVNGKEVREADLREGDQVKIGRFVFRFTAGPKINSSARRRSLPAGQLETDNGDVVPLSQRVVVIGQRAGCDLVLSNPAVSTTHAAIYDVNGRRYIMDLGSRSGTLVNNQKTLQVELKVGDVIDVGGTEVRYVAAAGTAVDTRAAVAKTAPSEPIAAADPDELLALESLNEAPAPPKPSGQSKLFEPPPSVPDDSSAPIPLEEDEVKLPEPEEEPEPLAQQEVEPERASVLEEVEETPQIEAEAQEPVAEASAADVAAEKAAEAELMALLEEASVDAEAEVQTEPQAEIKEEAETEEIPAEEEPPPALVQERPVQVEEAPVPMDEPESVPVMEEQPVPDEPAPIAMESADEPPLPVSGPEPQILPEQREEQEVEVAPEPIASVEPEPALEIAPEPEALVEPQVPLELSPEPLNEEGEVVGTATANVDVIPQPAEEVVEEVTEEVAEEVQNAATAFADDELPAVQEEEQEVAAEAAVEDPGGSAGVVEADIEQILEDEPPEQLLPPPEPVAVAPPEPEVPAAGEEEARQISQEPPKLAPGAPRPRWIAAPSTVQFTPTVLTIKPPRPPVDFDLNELLGEKKTPFATGNAPPIEQARPETPPPATPEPVEIAPQAIEEGAPADESSELVPPPPAAMQETAPPLEEAPALQEDINSDDLALAALEELAPTEPPSQPEPLSAEPTQVEESPAAEAETVEQVPQLEPIPIAATTSAAIVPEPPSAITTTSIAGVPEESEDLLEALPDESEMSSEAAQFDESSPILSSASAPAATTALTEVDEPVAPDVFSFGQTRQAAPAPAAPHHRRVGSPGRLPPRPRTSAPIPPRWGPLATAIVSENIPRATPRRARRKLSVLLVLMLLAMVLAALAVWKFVLPRVIVQGAIRFDNVANLRGEVRETFQKNQLELLADAKVRAAAEGLFKVRKPTAAGFFVDQDFRSPQLKREWVANGDRAELQITYQGTDPTLDQDRLYCLLQAIYDANSSSVSTATAATRTVDQKRMALSAARAELNKLRERRVALEAIIRPDPAELATAQAAVEKLDQAWTEALSARKAIAADVERLSQPTESATAGTASNGDSALKLMSEKLTALNGRLAEAKSSAAKQAADARKSLNSSIEDFQTSLGAAQGMMKDNTALAAYISSAQRLHEASWKFQGDLIERQERQQKQLLEYKKRLEEQVEAHKRELLEKDDGLKELNHLLELKRRELSALAATGGLKRDVEKLRSDVATLQERIMARTVLIGEDKFYQDAISGLKQIIDSVQGQLAADRGASEKLMNDLETRFRNTSPEIETLPAAQRTLAARLASQVTAMQAARKSYGEAVQAQDADANDRLKDLGAEAASLESEIALRRKELAAEQQKKLTEQQSEELRKKQAALADAEKSERSARDAYRQKIKELDILVDRERAYQSTREELQRIIKVEEPTKQDQQNAAERAVVIAQRAADSATAPQPPAQPKIVELQDYRFLWGTGAVLVVGLLFGSLIFFTAHSEPRHRREAPAAESNEEKPISA